MSFNDLYPQEPARKKYLNTDWSVEDTVFKQGVSAFQEAIECANPKVECIQIPEKSVLEDSKKKEEKKTVLQPEASKEVVVKEEKNTQNNEANARDAVADLVEYSHAGKPNEGEPASKPTMKAGNVSDLDFLFDETDSASKSTQESLPQTAKVVDLTPAAKTVVAVEDPFGESNTSKNWEVEAPSVSVKHEKKATSPESPVIDEESFKQVKKIVDSILEGVPLSKLEHYQSTLGDYTYQLNLDHHRARPEILGDSLAKIAACRDSILTPFIELSGIISALEDAEKYIVHVGSELFATGRSQKAREAVVLLSLSDLFVRQSKAKRLYDAYDKTYKAIGYQYDCVSRLISSQANETKSKDVYVGMIAKDVAQVSEDEKPPFDPPYKAVTPKTVHVAKSESNAPVPPSAISTKGLDAFKTPNKNEKISTSSTGFVNDGFEF